MTAKGSGSSSSADSYIGSLTSNSGIRYSIFRLRNVLINKKKRVKQKALIQHSFSTNLINDLPSVAAGELRIPKRFAKKFGNELSSAARLIVPNDFVWYVGLQYWKQEVFGFTTAGKYL